MKKRRRGQWWGLYALVPIAAALLFLAHVARVGSTLHEILLLVVGLSIPLSALMWSEKHRDLMRSEGVDARAEEEALAALGILPGRLAPPLTERQANHRSIVLARAWARHAGDTEQNSVDMVRHLGDDDARLE